MPTFAFAGGSGIAPNGFGQQDTVLFQNLWSTGDTWTILFSTTSGDVQLGAGRVTNAPSTFALTLANRVYLATGAQYLFSDNNDPTGWEVQNPGAGFVNVLTQYGSQDSIVGFASYQGMLAAFLRNTIQIWAVNADPSQFYLRQPLSNIGTNYGLSIQSLGDFDVLFLADSGYRSLRVRDSSLNATTTDMGSPIDLIIVPVLQAGGFGTPVSIVEPSANRYWGFLKDTIYVLSYFPDAKIRAWSTYSPTVKQPVAGTQTGFTPSKFIVYQGTVYCRATATIDGTNADWLISYGGGYDNSVMVVQTPFLSLKSQSTDKYAKGFDMAMTGSWTVETSMDQASGTFETSGTVSQPTFDDGMVPLGQEGTHVAFLLLTQGSTAAVLSSISFIFEPDGVN